MRREMRKHQSRSRRRRKSHTRHFRHRSNQARSTCSWKAGNIFSTRHSDWKRSGRSAKLQRRKSKANGRRSEKKPFVHPTRTPSSSLARKSTKAKDRRVALLMFISWHRKSGNKHVKNLGNPDVCIIFHKHFAISIVSTSQPDPPCHPKFDPRFFTLSHTHTLDDLSPWSSSERKSFASTPNSSCCCVRPLRRRLCVKAEAEIGFWS